MAVTRVAAALLAAAALHATVPADAQGWLFGKRRGEASGEAKVSGKYRDANRIRVDGHAGPFDGRTVTEAVLRRLAEMTRDKGADRFVIEQENCWQSMAGGVPGTNYCWAIAVMLPAGAVVPVGVEARRVVPIVGVLSATEQFDERVR